MARVGNTCTGAHIYLLFRKQKLSSSFEVYASNINCTRRAFSLEGYAFSGCYRYDLTCNLGPFFVHFPKLREALESNVPIKTQARACTILPSFVGYVHRTGLQIIRIYLRVFKAVVS